ncbi:unnamed protein product [Rotaria socialis]|uniref:Cytidyltransferase-like domain-containing protein n=1 Tax=Rotaria socialis TaxID=392032 RepID=A0A818ST29_9BILA|nr:unnamed protein product [Rotaria socialis]CAF3368429.1 unnamed protein product [Rotaria socialis]CAF3634933.1 unnamed protein product [Rotaria socialis]CAF3660252.1 unnamed protein product [Rotaria socialis]CAF3674390.1 unnamed protein product [Rotaria socialis]
MSEIHSERTTDLSILYANLKLRSNSLENVVLIKTGSMNPIHRSHVSNMVRTKKYLERACNFNVIGGYLSPTHDEYVYGKLSNELISGEHRIEMCRKAIEEAGQQHWLSVDMAECMAPGFVHLVSVAHSLQQFINQHLNLPKPVRVIYVAGLDLFNRCYGMGTLRKSPLGGVAVVYRLGQNNSVLKSTNAMNDPRVFYVCDNDDEMDTSSSESEDISSTLIRKRLKDNENCDDLTFKSVLDHMKKVSSKDC